MDFDFARIEIRLSEKEFISLVNDLFEKNIGLDGNFDTRLTKKHIIDAFDHIKTTLVLSYAIRKDNQNSI